MLYLNNKQVNDMYLNKAAVKSGFFNTKPIFEGEQPYDNLLNLGNYSTSAIKLLQKQLKICKNIDYLGVPLTGLKFNRNREDWYLIDPYNQNLFLLAVNEIADSERNNYAAGASGQLYDNLLINSWLIQTEAILRNGKYIIPRYYIKDKAITPELGDHTVREAIQQLIPYVEFEEGADSEDSYLSTYLMLTQLFLRNLFFGLNRSGSPADELNYLFEGYFHFEGSYSNGQGAIKLSGPVIDIIKERAFNCDSPFLFKQNGQDGDIEGMYFNTHAKNDYPIEYLADFMEVNSNNLLKAIYKDSPITKEDLSSATLPNCEIYYDSTFWKREGYNMYRFAKGQQPTTEDFLSRWYPWGYCQIYPIVWLNLLKSFYRKVIDTSISEEVLKKYDDWVQDKFKYMTPALNNLQYSSTNFLHGEVFYYSVIRSEYDKSYLDMLRTQVAAYRYKEQMSGTEFITCSDYGWLIAGFQKAWELHKIDL